MDGYPAYAVARTRERLGKDGCAARVEEIRRRLARAGYPELSRTDEEILSRRWFAYEVDEMAWPGQDETAFVLVRVVCHPPMPACLPSSSLTRRPRWWNATDTEAAR